MAMVSIQSEKYIITLRRFTIVSGQLGPGGHAEWKEQKATETTTVTNCRGDEADIRAKIEEAGGKGDESKTMRKIEGPWWEANITTVDRTDWEDVADVTPV